MPTIVNQVHCASTERTPSCMKYKMDKFIKQWQICMNIGHNYFERKYVNEKHNNLQRKYVNDKVPRLDTSFSQQ